MKQEVDYDLVGKSSSRQEQKKDFSEALITKVFQRLFPYVGGAVVLP